jgi:Uma2 family endonuclease
MPSAPEMLPVTAPADDVPGPPQGQWTYDDYAAVPDDGRRYEIIDGVLYMTPAPSTGHQNAAGWFFYYLRMYIQVPGLGVALAAPFDVEIGLGRTVVHPDVVVILKEHLSILTPSRAIGTPDLVVEVSSPSTANYDRRRKMDAYAEAEVPEYWIADAAARTVELLVLEGGEYRPLGVFQGGATLPSRVVPDLPVHVEQFFA